jgi:predicted enzyme related to lactoylglutathione lyase
MSKRFCLLPIRLLAMLVILVLSRPMVSQTVLILDHVSICGANLDPLRQDFADVGLTTDLGGPHGNGVTQMAALAFDDGTYIELIAPIKAGVTTGSDWAKYMSEEAVTCAWAVGTGDIAPEVDRLKKLGIAVTTPERGSRKRPDGMSIEWSTASVGSGTAGSVLPFIIEDETPRAWRVVTSASVHDSPLTGVENVVIAVNNLEAAIALFRKAYGWSDPITENQKEFGRTAYFPGEPVILASGGGWIADHIAKYGESPVAYMLAAKDFSAAVKKYHLSGGKTWFGQKVAWFDDRKLKGVRLGVFGQ